MTRTELADASDLLAAAAGETGDGDAGDRLDDVAEQLDRLATAEHGPDHGRLARIQTALDEVQSSVDDDVAASIEDALDEIRAYRETIEGV